jgi:hypothetical protein
VISLHWLFTLALLLYSGVIFSHKFFIKRLTVLLVGIFGTALAVDTFATVFVCVFAYDGWAWTLHTITGLGSLVIMAIHFGWAVVAIAKRGNSEIFFAKCSIYAWGVWIVAFVTGILLRT